MKCPNCGCEIRPQARFCGRCGAPRPGLLPGFSQAEARLDALQAQYQAGELDGAGFEAQRQALTTRGPDGAYWAPGGEGRWYRYEGDSWVERDPPVGPVLASPSRASRPGPPAHALPAEGTPQPAPAKKRLPWLWLGIGGLAIVATLACASAVWLRYGSSWWERRKVAPATGPSATLPAKAATPAPALAATPRAYLASFDGEEAGYFADQAGPDGLAATEAGAYCLEVTQPEHTFTSAWETGLTDLSLEVEGTLIEGGPGTAYGFLVRGTGENATGALAFEVDGQSRWRLRSNDPTGAYVERVGWTPSPAIDAGGGTNLLAAIVEGRRAILFVNGEEMVRVDDLPPGGTTIVLTVSTPAGQERGEACFDLLRAAEIGGTPHDDRQTVLAELGAPQAFDIAFGSDEDSVPLRYETWIYYDYLTALTFVDGTLVEEEPLEPVDAFVVAPAWYGPFDFSADMTLAQVQTLLGEGDLAQVSVPPELGQDMVLYAGEQIVVGFTAGQLEYVETLALQGMEETDEP